MNERLEKEVHNYRRKLIAEKYPDDYDVFIKECDWEDDIEDCARYFYNLALEDVRELIEKAKQSSANDVSYFALGVTDLADILLNKINQEGT